MTAGDATPAGASTPGLDLSGEAAAATLPALDDARDRSLEGIETASAVESWMAEVAAAPAVAPQIDVGDRLGDAYRIVDTLGAGAMGRVYLAHHDVLDRNVAIKLHRVSSPEAAESLLREARIAASVEHDNVIVVHEVGTWDRYVFVAMEYVDGTTARGWAEDRPGGKRRSWREVVELYVKAGRGLAAAHARGLIHGDFKPDNVLVGRDGRVRVADFGLARVRVDGTSSALRVEDARDSGATERLRGSPAYMAPEQYQTAEVDARADQFSFCVSLYEALAGRRPFEADSLIALATAITEGTARELDASTAPRHVRAALRRGLERDPARRFSDMNHLLAALARDPTKARARVIRWVAGLGATAAITWGLTRSPDAVRECIASPNVASWWSEARRDRVASAFDATGDPSAETAFSRIDERLTERGAAAVALLDASCRATHDEGTVARADLEQRKECLVQREREQTALLDLFEGRAPDVLERSVGAVESLPSIERCGSFGARPSAIPESERDAADRLLREIARIDETRRVGLYAQSVADAEALLPEVDASGLPSLGALLRSTLGASYSRLRKPALARRVFREALARAIALDDAPLALEITTHLLFTDGYLDASVDAGEAWASLAEGWLERLGHPRELEVEFLHTRGLARRAATRFADSLADTEAAIALWEAEHDRPAVFHANVLAALGETHRTMGNAALALPILQRAADEYLAVLGPVHPSYGNALNILGSAFLDLGKYDDAERAFRTALAIAAAGGRGGGAVAEVRSNLAGVLANTRRLAEAIDVLTHARQSAITDAIPAELIIGMTNNLARMNLMAGNQAAARTLVDEAVALSRRTVGEDNLMYAETLVIRAESETVDHAAALADADRAIALIEARLGPDAMRGFNARYVRARVLAFAGDCDRARRDADAAIAGFSRTFGPEHSIVMSPTVVVGVCQTQAGEYVAATETFDRVRDVVSSVPMEVMPWRLRALVGVGRVAEAKQTRDELRAEAIAEGRTALVETLDRVLPLSLLDGADRARRQK